MTIWKWECETRLEPDGHRAFRDASDDYTAPELRRWALTDNSGRWPETTDDGILWIDFTRPIVVSLAGTSVCVGYPLIVERDDQPSDTIGGLDSLLVMRRLFPAWPVSMSPALRVIIAALAPFATSPTD
jgi:hypothetical protein